MWEKGIIITNNNEVIAEPGLTLDELRQTDIGRQAEIEQDGLGDHRVGLGPMSIAEQDGVCATAYYHEYRLEKIFLNLDDEAVNRLWGTRRQAGVEFDFYKSWVEKETGRKSPASFEWGSVASVEDHWTFDASILFRYVGK